MASQLHLQAFPETGTSGCLRASTSFSRSRSIFRRTETKVFNGTRFPSLLRPTLQLNRPLNSGVIKASGVSRGKGPETLTCDGRLDLHDFQYVDRRDMNVTQVEGDVYGDSKGWPEYEAEGENQVLLAKILLVAAMASDRSEIHAIISSQRDNWNKLFQGTLRVATITAAILSALNGGSSRCVSLSLAAALLNVGSTAIMYLINQFQPSQLAEEQRTAARLFRDLAKDIETTLKIDRKLREEFNIFLESRIERLHMLDKAYPLPLTPGGLEKFPKIIAPTQLSPGVDESIPEIPVQSPLNGWTSDLAEDLKSISKLLETADVAIYLSWGKTVLKFNKMFAIVGPLFAAAAGALSIADALDVLNLSAFAACFSIMSMFVNSFSHDMQLGMIFELYRNAAGYFADVSASIQRSIRIPVEKRENGALFHQRIALKLGRRDQIPIISAEDKTAGCLF